MRPKVGDMVHVIDYEDTSRNRPCRAAIVLETDFPSSETITTKILRPHGDRVEFHVKHQELSDADAEVLPNTWHWPEVG